MKQIPSIVTAAEHANMSVKDWALDVLGKVSDPNMGQIRLPVVIYAKLRQAAYARGVSLEVFTTSTLMTDWLLQGLDGGRI